MVKHLVAEMEDELRTIDKLRRLLSDYQGQCDAIQPWLDVTPDLSDVMDVRKRFRSLKSKLRHKLADLQDAEEVRRGAIHKYSFPTSIIISLM